MRTFRTIAATATAALALGGALLAVPTAQAATTTSGAITRDGGLWYKATPGQNNQLTITDKVVDETEPGGSPEVYYVVTFDDRYDITFDANSAEWNRCEYPSADDHTIVQCVAPASLGSDDSPRYWVTVRDGNDTVKLSDDNNADAVVYGGPGNDTVTDSSLSAVLYGEDGNDRLHGGGGGWGMGPYGGKGHDTITACAWACYGGAGNDSLSGDAETNNMYGESGNDVIHGKQGRDSLNGGNGNDTLRGGRGADKLWGEDGNDTLWGDQDNDELWGNSGNDVLYGGAGTDKLSGGPGRNKVQQ
ncbi:calcium-binding protein [Streptomyces sp. CA-210063]|uniref:calcium-binding protein n=1 Tax=Streptomyces sp. CA-210063 TaxID=2801029 RepID=UPI00214B339E|nr:calcium-binding protein [Streptomyces sp. CA-210063]UUU31732.1 calcium-binding protein [Streptomyces sp. CA-210063]